MNKCILLIAILFSVACAELFLETVEQFEQSYPGRVANLAEFDQIQSPFARFVLRNERLRLAQSDCEIFLTKPRAEPELPEHSLQRFLFLGEDALLHRFIELHLTAYPKIG